MTLIDLLLICTNFTQIMADACTPSSSEKSDSIESVGLLALDGFSKSSSGSSEDVSRSGLGKPAPTAENGFATKVLSTVRRAV